MMENKNIETIAAPVGTVRRFVSEQYLANYKTTTLDNAYASKALASVSVDGLMSKTDKAKLDKMAAGNTSLTTTLQKSSWSYSTKGVYTTLLTHNLDNEILYIGAYDIDTKENVLLSYKVVSNNVLELSLTEPLNLSVTVVFKGDIVRNENTVIDDGTTSSTSTWSSNNIVRKIEQLASNSQFKITVPSGNWVQDGLIVSTTINHGINKKILYIGAYDSATSESLFVSYTIINDTSLKLSIESALDAVITIVFEGSLVNLAGGDIVDTKTSLNSTWSSAKIESYLPSLATSGKDGLLSKEDKVIIDGLPTQISSLETTVDNLETTVTNKIDKSSITFSTSDPSGGKHGDIWFKYEE